MLIKKRLAFWSLILISVTINACGQSPQKAILKRWQAVDLKGKGRDWFLYKTANRPVEMEFTANGVVIMYEAGVMKATLPYTMAADGKSYVLTDPAGKSDMPVKIIRLNATELVITSRMYENDTLILKPKIRN